MTRLINDAAEFADEALAGYAAANEDRVAAVHGGVVRSTVTPAGQVSVVMGGGSGHFPAFAGWVGVGFGHGAACGNIFASPSEAQIYSVARAADNGGGVLFAPINYAGDILHFGGAAEKLRGEGLDVRMVAITDDIASGSADEHHLRRGIGGSMIVLKITGASAERGDSLDDVERIITKANDVTRTLGVAFSGCTLPGSAEPLFTVPQGKVAVGLGIHGEPGISEVDLQSADQVADVMVDGLFTERAPQPGGRVAVLVNGLGATKYDELHVIFRRVKERLEAEDMTLVSPVVGELVTSLDMAGASVSLTYLDDELETLWLDAADTAFFSRGSATARAHREVLDSSATSADIEPGSDSSQQLAALILKALERASEVLHTNEDRLGALDAVAGDGDHGIGMTRGITAAVAAASTAVAAGAGAGTTLALAGEEWSDKAGGTSGALWGSGLIAAGGILGDEEPADATAVARAMRAYLGAIVTRGSAEVGDKTMVDAIVPFVDELERLVAGGVTTRDAWRGAAASATAAAEYTKEIAAKRGRSRLHGDKSIGVPDAGAISFALVMEAVSSELNEL